MLCSAVLFYRIDRRSILPAFLRTQFSASVTIRSIVLAIAALGYVSASLFSGRIVSRFGAKIPAAIGCAMQGSFIFAFFFAPNLWVAIALDIGSACFSALALSSLNSLVLDQVPESRGAAVSINRVFQKMGDAAVPAIGGLLLVLFASYQLMGIVFLAMDLVAAIFFLSAQDIVKVSR
jgi:MFS family permease